MRRTETLQEIRRMRFEEADFGWSEDRLTQEEAARILGVCDRTFRRHINFVMLIQNPLVKYPDILFRIIFDPTFWVKNHGGTGFLVI